MFYVCIATEEEKPRVMYPGHFVKKVDADKRADMLKFECYNHDGAMWKLYQGEEPFEAAHARWTASAIKDETQEACKIRLDALSLKAAKSSKSVLTEPEIDDRPKEVKR